MLCSVQQFSLSILARATNDFHESRLIGKGGFSQVYRGLIFGTTVAIKQLSHSCVLAQYIAIAIYLQDGAIALANNPIFTVSEQLRTEIKALTK